jgi:hypothetical protein
VRYELEEGGRVERKAENRQKNEEYQTCAILRFSSPPPTPTHTGVITRGGGVGGGEGEKRGGKCVDKLHRPSPPTHTHTGSVQNRIE